MWGRRRMRRSRLGDSGMGRGRRDNRARGGGGELERFLYAALHGSSVFEKVHEAYGDADVHHIRLKATENKRETRGGVKRGNNRERRRLRERERKRREWDSSGW